MPRILHVAKPVIPPTGLAIFAIVGVLGFSPIVRAQNTGANPEAESDEIGDPVFVDQWVRTAGRGPQRFAQAVAALARAGEWSSVDQLLRRVDPQNAPESELAMISRQLGPALSLRARSRIDLSDQATDVLERAVDADQAALQSPELLMEAIQTLESGNREDKLAGMRILLSGGDAAIAAIVESLVARDPTRSRRDTIRVLRDLGGLDALLPFAIYGDDPQRARALSALGGVRTVMSDVAVLTALHATDATATESRIAETVARRRFGGLPSRPRTLKALSALLERQVQQAEAEPLDESSTVVWLPDVSAGTIESIRTDTKIQQWRDAVDIAASIRRMGTLDDELRIRSALADMEYRMLVDPDWGDPSQVAGLRDTYPWLAEPASMSRLLATAKVADRYAAAILNLRAIRAGLVEAPVRLLTDDQPETSPLVSLASSSIPRVRYEATATIRSISGDAAYAGASRVDRTLSEMRGLSDRPSVILIETRLDMRVELERLLGSMGYQVQTAASVAEALRLVAAGGDHRFILSKTQLSDLPPIELVDRVRRMSLGERLPILFFSDASSQSITLPWLGSQRWPALTTLIDRPATPSGLQTPLERIQRERVVPPLSAADRALFRRYPDLIAEVTP